MEGNNMPKYPQIELDLTQIDGNLNVILARVQTLFKRAGLTKEQFLELNAAVKHPDNDYDDAIATLGEWINTDDYDEEEYDEEEDE